MARSHIFFRKPYISIWLLLIMLVFTACSSPSLEPSVEFVSDSTIVDSQIQQSYPAPEQRLVEDRVQSGYPGPPPNDRPVRATPYPTLIPPPACGLKPPVEVAMSYEEAKGNFPAFSEPTIAATNSVGFSIAEWLPDSQRLLVSQGDGAFGSISTLDITTGEMVEYAKRRDVSSLPIWLDETQTVMFIEATTGGWELRLSDGKETITLADELASVSLAKDSINQRVATVFSLEPGALMTVDTTGRTDFITASRLNEETKRIPLSSGDGYHLAWSPNGNWLVQYKGENLYLINTQNQKICSMNLGNYGEAGRGRVFSVQWSPDGRYLSMGIQRQNPTPELNILDIERMELSILSLPLETETWPPESIGRRTWSPDSQMLLLQTGMYDDEIGRTQAKLLIINVQTHKFTNVFPDYTFLPGGGRIAWSLDGSKIAYSCHTLKEGNVCIIDVSQ